MTNKIHVFTNDDKDPIKEPHNLINLADHKRSSRIIITGPPDSGKSNIVKNLIINQNPAFDEIYLVTPDITTKEYNSLCCNMCSSYEELPKYEDIDPSTKTLIIFEDYEFDDLNKKELKFIDAYFRYACTHKGMTIYMCCQNYFTIPPKLRRKANITYFARFDDRTMSIIFGSLGICQKKFQYLCDVYLKDNHDFVCIDSSGHPVKYRHNIFDPIKI